MQSVFYGGRLAPEKNIDSVIEAARRSEPHQSSPSAGDGPQREEIEDPCRVSAQS